MKKTIPAILLLTVLLTNCQKDYVPKRKLNEVETLVSPPIKIPISAYPACSANGSHTQYHDDTPFGRMLFTYVMYNGIVTSFYAEDAELHPYGTFDQDGGITVTTGNNTGVAKGQGYGNYPSTYTYYTHHWEYAWSYNVDKCTFSGSWSYIQMLQGSKDSLKIMWTLKDTLKINP